LKDIFWCLEVVSELDPNSDKGPKFSGGRICNESGKEIKGKHFSIGKRRYNLCAKRCWLSNEPLVKKHYKVYCFTRKYDGVHIYRTMNPDSREKWTSKCAKTGKPILGPYVKAIGKLWLKNEFKCHISG
jgi:hypothetical protein